MKLFFFIISWVRIQDGLQFWPEMLKDTKEINMGLLIVHKNIYICLYNKLLCAQWQFGNTWSSIGLLEKLTMEMAKIQDFFYNFAPKCYRLRMYTSKC